MKRTLRFYVVALLAIIGVVSNAVAQDPGPTPATVTTTLPATAKAHGDVPFAVQITRNDETAANIELVFKLTGDNAATQASQIELKSAAGEAIAVNENGEAVLATSAFTGDLNLEYSIKFKAVGNFSYTMELRDAADDALLDDVTGAVAVTFLEPTVETTLDIVSEGPLKIRTNEDVLFSLYASPNDRTGEMVNIRLTLADRTQSDNFTLMYNTTGNEFETLTVGEDGVLLFGPEEGFEFSEDIDQLMKINFSEAGNYTYTVDVLRVDGNVIGSVTETVSVLEGATVASTLNGTTIVRDRTVDFTVNVEAGSWPNTTEVLARVVLENPAQAEDIQLFYQDAEGDYQPLAFNAEGVAYYGDPVAGINLADGTLNLRVIASEVGTYNYRIELEKKVDEQLAAVSEESVTVRFINASIASDLNNREGVKTTVAEEFTATITPGDENPATEVFGRLTLANPAQAANIKLEVLNTLDGTYTEIPIGQDGTVTIGEDGGITLGQLSELNFRATFSAAGTYNYKIDLIRVSDNSAIATANESVTVTAFELATISSDLNNREGVRVNQTQDVNVTTVANDNAGTAVRVKLMLANTAQAENVALQYRTDEGIFAPLAIDANGVAYYGPEAGFALADATTPLKVTFNQAGTYNYTLAIVTAGETETAIASVNESVVVAAEPVAATITSNYTNADNIIAGEATTFTLTTTKGDLTDRAARFKFILNDPAQASNVTIENTDATEPSRLSFDNGVALYTPAAGPVTVSDATYNFTALFGAAGTYSYTVQLVDATNTNEVLASTNVSVEAKTQTSIKKGFEKGGFAVYPTLTTGAVKVDLVNARNASIQVIDMMGRAVVAKNNLNGVVELDLSRVAKGTYIVKIQDGNNVNTQRVIVR